MNLWTADRIMDRLNRMLEHAIAGEPVETSYDETKMSALETKLVQYLEMNQLGKQQLEAQKERINALISDISHQTKTPIANMLLYSELLAEEITDEKSRKMLAAIHMQAEKLSFLTQALVELSRLEAGVIQTVPEPNPVDKLIEKVVSQTEPKALQKELHMEVSSMAGDAFFDMKWTSEAVGNILDNAVKYSNIGGKIQITAYDYSLFTRLDIKDDGIGIAKEDLPKIFGRFYKCSATQQEEGVGLGLYLARKIISGQGGCIKVISQIGKGTIFSVFLKRSA